MSPSHDSAGVLFNVLGSMLFAVLCIYQPAPATDGRSGVWLAHADGLPGLPRVFLAATRNRYQYAGGTLVRHIAEHAGQPVFHPPGWQPAAIRGTGSIALAVLALIIEGGCVLRKGKRAQYA